MMRNLLASLALHAVAIAAIMVICRSRTNSPDVVEVIDLDMEIAPIEFMELGANEQSIEQYADAPLETAATEPPSERPPIEPEELVDEPETTDEAEAVTAKAPPVETPTPPTPVKKSNRSTAAIAANDNLEQAKIVAATCNRDTIRPRYPKRSRQRGEQGEVKMEVSVAADGTVTAVRVTASSGYPRLDDAAMNAVRNADFTAARDGDKAIPSTVSISLNFKLD